MKRSHLSYLLLLFFSIATNAQNSFTQWGQPTNQPKFPVSEYLEMSNWENCDASHWGAIQRIQAGWGSVDQRYPSKSIPNHQLSQSLQLRGWRGERIYAQAVVLSPEQTEISYKISGFSNSDGCISSEYFNVGFTRSVISDARPIGCGLRDTRLMADSSFIPDPIDHITQKLNLDEQTCQGIWITCWIPTNIPAGLYTGSLDIYANGDLVEKLPLSVTALKRTLPKPQEWSYHLDLWQNPFAVARYHQVDLWSDAHMDLLKPMMQRLSNAGQKTITATINHMPWDGQTEDAFPSMVTWIKKANGEWSFDYTVFDKWVGLMMDVGIDNYISCYSIIPWPDHLTYFDQATNSMQKLPFQLTDPNFEKLWRIMLTSFASHLEEKGWLDKCILSMDEIGVEQTQKVMNMVREIEPRFKFSLAAHHYNDQIGDQLVDFSSAWSSPFSRDVLEKRRDAGRVSTYYTCCTESFPNTFTCSHPAEAAWISGRIAKEGLDGYLRWAYNSWTREPLLDARFRRWTSGDTFLVYPGDRSSIRFERLVDGIQLCEKVNILRDEFKDCPAMLRKIDRILSSFTLQQLSSPQDAAHIVSSAKECINNL